MIFARLRGPCAPTSWIGQPGPLRIRVAKGFRQRFFGLALWQSWGDSPCALMFTSCCAIHTFGLCVPIDAIFLNKTGRICSFVSNLAPNRIALDRAAGAVLELPAQYCRQEHWRNQVEKALSDWKMVA